MSTFPIDLSNTEQAVFLCMWNGDEIIELHTLDSLRVKYSTTNLFDVKEFRDFFDTSLSFEEYVLQMGHGDYHIFDNLRIECVKSGGK
jgi:hypothetical protein